MSELKRRVVTVVMAVAIATVGWVSGGSAATVPQVTILPSIVDGVKTPVRLAEDAAGNLYLTDPRGGGILKYNGSGKLLQAFPTLRPPQGVAVTSTGSLLVGQGDFVSLLDATGKELRRLGAGAGQFQMANGIALDDTGRIYVTDSVANCVQVFSAAGDYLSRFGSTGIGLGQFSTPTGIAFEKTARQLAVVDSFNGRVEFFDTNGIYQKTLFSFGSGPLKLTLPQGVAFEYTTDAVPQLARMYVADSFQSSVQVIDPAGSGTFLSFIGEYGAGPGQLIAPVDAIYDAAGHRLVVANGAGSVALFGIGTGYVPVDTTPPALSLNPPPASTATASLTLSGTVEAGATVKVAVNGGTAVAASVSGTAWSAGVGLVPGSNAITVTAADSAGNLTTATATVALVIPATTFTVNPVQPLVGATSTTIGGTRGSGVTLTVTSTTTGAAATVSYPTATTWQASVTGLAEGSNQLTVASGGAFENVTVTVDTRAPQLTVSALATGSHTADRVQNVTVAVSEPHLQSLKVNGVAVPVVNGVASAPVILVNGSTTVTVSAVDQVGNTATDTRSLVFDPQVPDLSITAPADVIRTRTAVVELSGSAAAAATVTVNGQPATISNTGWSQRVTLNPGLNTIVVTATTGSGSAATLKRTVFYDNAPTVMLATPTEDTALSAGSTMLYGTTEDGVTLTATVNGTTVPVTKSGSTFSLPVTLAQEGTYAVTVTATDATGATATAFRSLVADRTPPRLLLTGQTVPAPAVLQGTADADATVTVADRSGTLAVLTPVGGSWSLNLAALAYDAATLRVTAADAAGNLLARTLAAPAPTGDVNGDGKVTVSDVLQVLRMAVGAVTPTADDYTNGDVAPVVNGKVQPDGKIDIQDAVEILRKVVGVATW